MFLYLIYILQSIPNNLIKSIEYCDFVVAFNPIKLWESYAVQYSHTVFCPQYSSTEPQAAAFEMTVELMLARTFLQTTNMLKLHISLCCYFMFILFQVFFFISSYDNAALLLWLGLGTETTRLG